MTALSLREKVQRAMKSQDPKPTAKEAHIENELKALQAAGSIDQDSRGLWFKTGTGPVNWGWSLGVKMRLLEDATARRRIDEGNPSRAKF